MTGCLVAAAAALTNLTGVVTFARDGLPFCFMRDDGGANWRVGRAEGAKVEVGDRIEAQGTREPSTVKLRLATTELKSLGPEPGGPPPPVEVGIEELFEAIAPYGNADWYGGTYTTEGLLRDINRRETTTQLLVGEGERNIQVEMPWDIRKPLPDKLVAGARVRVTGALAYTSIEDFDGAMQRIENVELIPVSGDDILVVKRAPKPPFWTGRRLAAAFGAGAGAILVMFVWVAILRIMVRRRTRELADSIRQRERAGIEADAARRERLRLAADLHDGFQQYLAGAMFRLKAAMNYLPDDASRSREQLDKVQEALQHTQNGLRATLWAMNEESEGPESLTGLFRFVARRMAHWEGLVEIRGEGEERAIARKYCGSLLLVMQEAVGNALKHGAARHVLVTVSFGEGGVDVSISDDGCGFDPAAARSAGGYGLSTMERRIGELGGTFRIDSAPGRGTVVVCSIPAARMV